MLHVQRSDRADGLLAGLRELLAEPPDDPFARELVAVPTRGMERWLTQRMAAVLGAPPGRGDGVCPNVEFPFPRRLTAAAVAAATGIDPETDPWLPERLVWPLLEVVDAGRGEAWLAALPQPPVAGPVGGGGAYRRTVRPLRHAPPRAAAPGRRLAAAALAAPGRARPGARSRHAARA